MQLPDIIEMFFQGKFYTFRKHSHPVFLPLTVANHNLVHFKIDIFHPQSYTFNTPKSTAIKKFYN